MTKFGFPCSYLLLVWVGKDTQIRVGALGEVSLPEGWYVYAGRARKSIYQRIKRHLRQEKKHFWHIDYLLKAGEVRGIAVFKGEIECELVQTLCKAGVCSLLKPGLGSSDCQCKAHFLKIEEQVAFLWSDIGNFLRRRGLPVEKVVICFSENGPLREFEIKVLASFGHCVPHSPGNSY